MINAYGLVRLRSTRPVIVVGMHRSGTSLVSRLLMRLGVHMGRRPSRNAESRVFQRLNRELLARLGGSWARVESVVAALQSEERVGEEAAWLLGRLGRLRFLSYFDRARQPGVLFGWPPPYWGWKDPRSSVLLPVWLSVFPHARVLHVARDGVDAALSLRDRQEDYPETGRDFDPSVRALPDCFALWERYLAAIHVHTEDLPEDRYLEVRYEQLLRAPQVVIDAIASFLELPAGASQAASVTAIVERGRTDRATARAAWRDEIARLPQSILRRRYAAREGAG